METTTDWLKTEAEKLQTEIQRLQECLIDVKSRLAHSDRHVICADCGAIVGPNDNHECSQMRRANRRMR